MTLLLLAGTAEARQVAQGLAARSIEAIASLAGVTAMVKSYAIPTRTGGYGGEAEFEAFLSDSQITAILDATHPFANRISQRSAATALQKGLPYMQLLRPIWYGTPQDNWSHFATLHQAVDSLPKGAKVFLATGAKDHPRSAQLEHCDVTLRVVDPPRGGFPYPQGRYIVARPPFNLAAEIAMLQKLGIDHLVVKNAGGVTSAKLLAARQLGIKVLMVDRPAQPAGPKVETVAAMLAWAEGL